MENLKLREHLFRDAFPPMHRHVYPDQGPPFPPYMGRREFSPPPFHSYAGPPHGGFHPLDDCPPFMHHRPGFPPPHISDRMPPMGPWGPQGLTEGGGPMGMPDYGGPPRRIGGFLGGHGHPAIITTTVEVVVPRPVVPAIYGEDGGSLKQIREISDAKITIMDPKPGAT